MPERQPQPQNALTLPFLMQISHAGPQEIPKRNHPCQPAVMGVDYGKPRETCLGHAKDDGAQGFLRVSHHWFPQNVAKRNPRSSRINKFV